MPQIQPGVHKRMENPDDARVTLLVGLKAATQANVEQLENIGDVEEVLPYDIVAVSVHEEELEALCSLDTVESIEVEETGSQMQSGGTGNQNSPLDSPP